MKKLILFFVVMLSFLGCRQQQQQQQVQEAEGYDLPQMRDSGEIVALTMYGSTSYFNYRGQDMGFQYELSQQFANSLGLTLRVEVAKSVPELIEKLLSGEGDFIAYNLPITTELRDSVIYCGEEMITHQVIVQQSYGKNELLQDVTELIGKDVYVHPQSRYHDRLINLNMELGGGINIHLVNEDSLSVEDLIMQVAQGTIPYTVADSDVAALNKTYYSNLNINLQVSYDQRASWAVRRTSPQLAEAADQWQLENEVSPNYTASVKRYFETSKNVAYAPILSPRDGVISQFDNLFRIYSQQINWDWRLLAALAYTESNFDPTVVSWAGARGLMQLMPATARAMGVPAGMEHDPEESIKGAVRYISTTERSLRSVADSQERINFVLGAYNGGLGHVYDAMALAEKYGSNPHVWFDNVEKFILLKSNPEYYNDPVVRNGYFRGVETYNFVRDINARFNTYRSRVPL